MEFTEKLLGLIGSPKDFYKTLNKIRTDNFKSKTEEFSGLLIELNTKYKIDFCFLGFKAISDDYDCWTIKRNIQSAFPEFKLKINTTLEFIKIAYEKGNCNLIDLITQLSAKQPKFISVLLEKLEGYNEPFIVDYISAIYISLSKDDLSKIHSILINQVDDISVYNQQGAITALGSLDYSIDNKMVLLNKTIDKLTSIIENKDSNLLKYITIAFGHLLKYSNLIPDKLIELKKMNINEINYQLAFILFKESKERCNEEWFKTLFILFVKTPDEHKAIIDYLDYVISDYIETKNYDFIIKFLSDWFLQGKRNVKKNEFKTQFGSTLNAILENVELLEIIITTFFNEDNYQFHFIASQMLDYNNLYTKQEVRLNSKILSTLNFKDRVFICRKIIGYLYDTKTICSLLFSFLEITPLKKDTEKLIISFFLHLLAVNDPNDTQVFFETKIKNQMLNKSQKHLCNKGIEIIQEQINSLKELPRLKEFDLPQKYYYQIQLEQSKEMRESMEKVENKSVFLQSITKTPLKFGRGWFAFIEHIDDYSNISYLSKISHSVSIPFSEISYPVHNSLLRFSFQLAKR